MNGKILSSLNCLHDEHWQKRLGNGSSLFKRCLRTGQCDDEASRILLPLFDEYGDLTPLPSLICFFSHHLRAELATLEKDKEHITSSIGNDLFIWSAADVCVLRSARWDGHPLHPKSCPIYGSWCAFWWGSCESSESHPKFENSGKEKGSKRTWSGQMEESSSKS